MKNSIQTIISSFLRGALPLAIRRFISPLFLVMFFASFIFWYVTKLGYTYTTELDVTMRIADQKFTTTCVVEGVGANLLGYHIYKGGAVKLNLDEVKYRIVKGDDGERYVRLDKGGLSKLVSVHYSDIKLISMNTPPDVYYSERIKDSLKE